MTAATKNALKIALVSESLADEVEAKLASPGAISSDLSRNLEIAVADKAAHAEIKTALETGVASLSKRSSDALANALGSKSMSLELFTEA